MSSAVAKTTSIAVTIGIALLTTSNYVQAQSTTPQELEPILGIVVPNKTTIPEVAEALREKGCEFKERSEKDADLETMIEVEPKCFYLEGSPVVLFGSAPNSQTVDGVSLLFKNGGSKHMFNQYLQRLIASYGQPGDIKQEFLWNSYFWPKMEQKFFVNFVGSPQTGPFLITYAMGPAAKTAYDKWQELVKGQKD